MYQLAPIFLIRFSMWIEIAQMNISNTKHLKLQLIKIKLHETYEKFIRPAQTWLIYLLLMNEKLKSY